MGNNQKIPNWEHAKSDMFLKIQLIRVHISISFSSLPVRQFCFYTIQLQLGDQKFKHFKFRTVLLNFVSLG